MSLDTDFNRPLRHDDEGDLDADIRVRRRWPLVVFGLVLAAAIGAGVWYFALRVETVPNKIIIAVQAAPQGEDAAYWWEGDPAAVAIGEAFVDSLTALGLEPIISSEARDALEAADSDEALREVAAKLGARFIVTGQARIVRTVPLDGKLYDYSIELSLGLIDTESGEVSEVPGGVLQFFEWGRDPGEALIATAERMAAAGTAPLAHGFAGHPVFERLLHEKDTLTYDEATIASDLEPLFRIGGHYARQMQQRADDEKQEALDNEAVERSGIEPGLLGEFLAEEHFVGAGPADQVLLLVEPHYIDVQPDQGEYNLRRESERLVLAGRDGQARTMLFEHFNFFSAPDISADGSKVVAVIDNRQRSKWLVAVDVPSGKVTPLLEHTRHYFSSPSVSPDGSRVVYWYRERRRAPSALEVIGTDGAGRALLVDASVSMSFPQWSPDSSTVFLAVGSSERDSVVAINVDSREQVFLLGPSARPASETPPETEAAQALAPDPDAVAEAGADRPDWNPLYDSMFDEPVVDPTGKAIYAQEYDGQTHYVGRYNLSDGTYERLAELRVVYMQVSADGRFLAVQTRGFSHPDDPGQGDDEVVLLATAGGALSPVTLNAVDDQLGGWSRDSKSVFVSQQSRDPSARRYSSRVFRYDVE